MPWQISQTKDGLCKNRRRNHNRLRCLQEFADAIKMRGAWTKKMTAVAQAKDWKILPSAKNITAEQKQPI